MTWFLKFISPTLLYPHIYFTPSIFRNYPGGGQQEGAPHRPDSPGAAAGRHLRQEPPCASIPHAVPGRPRDRVLQAGRD